MQTVNLEAVCKNTDLPTLERFQSWFKKSVPENASVNIRIVDTDESQEVNLEYRGKDKPTNVLSFEFECPDFIDPIETDYLIGDLLICADVVQNEAKEQNKPLISHWAHIFIHGLLHLQGHDHIEDDEAKVMEDLERDILAKFDIPDPYIQEKTL
ncbi:MAG: rRNA maturation RNase YbeY [Pseudomonadales bacterium]|nr:rRNA maturation RNase YbeY [Pseudomonadales bacterium]